MSVAFLGYKNGNYGSRGILTNSAILGGNAGVFVPD